MITELTAEQQSRFAEFIEKWTQVGLCTDPADRPKAEEGVRLSYRIAGLEPPSKIVWCGSPFAMCLGRIMARWAREATGYATRSEIGGKSDWISSLAFAPDSRMPAVESVWLAVVSEIANYDVYSLQILFDNILGYEFSLDLDWVRHSVGNSIHGQHRSNWYAYYDYLRIVCGMTTATARFLGEMQVAENAGWWLPHQNICWISERPSRVKFDDRGRLHCEDGPAITYPDGWSIYAIHGVRLDEQVVMSPASQDVDDIRNEPNAEVKRIRIERFGWAEYLREVGATVLDVRDNDVEATREALMQTDGQVVLVCACPSTSRVYCLEVPPTVTTCEGAQDWLSGGLSHQVINGA